MTSKGQGRETSIDVTLDEPLTSNSCVKLVLEFLKYILYQKQQIPFTCDSLALLQAKAKPTDRNAGSIKTLLNSLKTMSEHLHRQLHLDGCKVKEIAIIVGATIFSPKLHVRIELPQEILNSEDHFECKHAPRKPLLNLVRSILESSEFQDAMSLPLGPTNTFVMLEKSDCNSTSDFFLLKPQYSPPVTCFRVKLHQSNQTKLVCNCIDMVKVYHELSESADNQTAESCLLRNPDGEIMQAPYKWYQSKEVIRGFKYIR